MMMMIVVVFMAGRLLRTAHRRPSLYRPRHASPHRPGRDGTHRTRRCSLNPSGALQGLICNLSRTRLFSSLSIRLVFVAAINFFVGESCAPQQTQTTPTHTPYRRLFLVEWLFAPLAKLWHLRLVEASEVRHLLFFPFKIGSAGRSALIQSTSDVAPYIATRQREQSKSGATDPATLHRLPSDEPRAHRTRRCLSKLSGALQGLICKVLNV